MTDPNHIEVLQRIRDGYFPHGAEQRAALDAAITALSARASAGEGGEKRFIYTYRCMACRFEADMCDSAKIALVKCPCGGTMQRKDNDPIASFTAAPQPAQSGASGGGEPDLRKYRGVAQMAIDYASLVATPVDEDLARELLAVIDHKHDLTHNPDTGVVKCYGCNYESRETTTPASPATGDELTADFTNALPSGKLDASTFGQIEDALDRAEAPMQSDDGRWLTLPERITALTTSQPAADAPTEGSWIAAADVRRLAREIDVAFNGEEGAARAPALCDIAAQVKAEARKLGRPILATPQPESARGEWVMVDGRRYDVETVKTALLGLASDVIAAAPQPQQASAHDGDVCQYCGFRSVEQTQLNAAFSKLADFNPGADEFTEALEVLRNHIATPPAHGDGEGDIEAAAIALANHDRKHPNARAYWDWLHDDEKAKFRSKARAVLSATRPTPEAQEARDAARYRWLRQFDIGIDHQGYDDYRWYAYAKPEPRNGRLGLDAVIDAALALPAQGEGIVGKKRDPNCRECEGEGWVYDYLGGCGDPECCGGPAQVQCLACDNDWSPYDNEDESP